PAASLLPSLRLSFVSHASATTDSYPLSLHDVLPIFRLQGNPVEVMVRGHSVAAAQVQRKQPETPAGAAAPHAHILAVGLPAHAVDRKSTRLNSSHVKISYAVFCLKKKTTTRQLHRHT